MFTNSLQLGPSCKSAIYSRMEDREQMRHVTWKLFHWLASMPGRAGWIALAIYNCANKNHAPLVIISCRQLAKDLDISPRSLKRGLNTLSQFWVLEIEYWWQDTVVVVVREDFFDLA